MIGIPSFCYTINSITFSFFLFYWTSRLQYCRSLKNVIYSQKFQSLFMKCISLKQPYAEMLAVGKKIIECRKWCTKFRGDFLIHASKNVDIKSCNYYNIDENSIIKGAIIGKANLYDVKKYLNYKDFLLDANKHLSIGIPDDKTIYVFLIKDAAKLEQMIPYKGKLGFFDVNLY